MIGRMKVDYHHIKKGDLVNIDSVDYENESAFVLVDYSPRKTYCDFDFDEVELIKDEVHTPFGMSKRKEEWEKCQNS